MVADRNRGAVGKLAPERTFRRGGAGAERIAASRAFEWFARAGFVARGTIYVVLGILAAGLALGVGGRPVSQQGAFQAIARQSFGGVLLVLVAAGLAGYSLWRLTRGALGHGPEGADSGTEQLAALASGIAYAVLCALAVEILIGSGGGSSASPQKPAAGVLGWPAGTWLVGAVGVAVVGVGFYQGYRGVTRSFLDDSKTAQMRSVARSSFEWIGTFGYLARMVVFVLVGVFLVRAAVDFNPSKAVGLDGALTQLLHAPYGPFMVGLVAAGLLAFGLFSLSDARYHRI